MVSDEFFHNSTYRGKAATIKRNTSGVVIPATDPSDTGSGASSQGSAETTVPHIGDTSGNTATAESQQEKPTAQETQPSKSQGPASDTEETTAPAENIIPPNPLN